MDRTYQILTNLSCNLACTYCYEHKVNKNNNAQDIVDFLHACFDRDKDLPKTEGAIIDIIGGEPFMQPKLLLTLLLLAWLLAPLAPLPTPQHTKHRSMAVNSPPASP